MGRAPCCDKEGVKKGPWTAEEDQKLVDYIKRNGHGSWRTLPKRAGLIRCGKSCRLRWINYLRPDIKRGKFSFEEEQTIIQLHGVMGNKWSAIAARLPGRTDNEIKNFWNSRLRKRLLQMGIDPVTHRPRTDLLDFSNVTYLRMAAEWENARLQEAMMREYYEILMRLQLENSSFSRPDLTTEALLSQILAQNPQTQLDNASISRVLQQLQSQSQMMNNLQHLSPTSTLDGLGTQLQHQDNNSAPSQMINSQTTVTPDENSNPMDSYLLNARKLMSQQQPCFKSHDISSSLALNTSMVWPENHLFGFSRSDTDSDLPALRSSTSSPGAFNEADLVPETSSSIASMSGNTSSAFTGTCDESFKVPLEFVVNSTETSEHKEKIAMENVEDDQVYWSNVLRSVAESL